MPRDLSKLVVAITGASSGIGAAAAMAFARRGAAVAICARRKDRLEEVATACREAGARGVLVRAADVGVWKDLESFARQTREALGDASLVLANAGYGNLGNTLDIPPAEIEALVRTNVTGALWTVQAFADQLQRARGHAIVVGSVVSKIAVPYSSVYSATKWALRGWTRGARPELERRNIALTLLNPGFVRTEFFQHRVNAPGVAPWKPDRGMTAEQVAKRILRIARRRPAEVDLTWLARFGTFFYRLMPIQAPRLVARWFRRGIE